MMDSSAPELIDFFSKVGVGVITGVIAAYLTAKGAITRFYHEKWWEKKHAAYNQLLDCLFEMKDRSSQASNYLCRVREAHNRQQDEPKDNIDWNRLHELATQVRRFATLSPITLSITTKTMLQEFLEAEIQRNYAIYEESYPEAIALSETVNEIQELIDSVVIDASRELHFK